MSSSSKDAKASSSQQSQQKARASFVSSAKFADLPGLHPATLKALGPDGFGYATMSAAQSTYLPRAMEDPSRDLLVRASTGSGKTLGFLIPTIQRIVEWKTKKSASSSTASSPLFAGAPPLAIVLSPSRELADQTKREALRLVQFHASPKIGVQLVIGGTPTSKDRRRLATEPCDLLIATPGRLQEHISDTPGFAEALRKSVKILVLDEADRLLDMGFEPAVRKIAAALPPASPANGRQTMLFSATVPDKVKSVALAFSRPDKLDFVDAGGPRASARNRGVVQQLAVVPVASIFPVMHRVLSAHIDETNGQHRIIVFVATARMAEAAASLLRASGWPDALEIHSRLSQGQRTAAERAFSASPGKILVASDVVARGIDFPDVTLVVQMGIASSKEQYEHRVGRTGRGGKTGHALVVAGDDEVVALQAMGLDTLPSPPWASMGSRPSKASQSLSVVPPALAKAIDAVHTGRNAALKRDLCRAFTASLGFYNTHLKTLRWTREALVANMLARFAALGVSFDSAASNACSVDPKTLKKMHLDPSLF